MTNPRHMAAGLALVFAANLPAVTNASPNPAMVAVNSTARSAHMPGPLPLENTYFPAVSGWVARMTGKENQPRDQANTQLLENIRGTIREQSGVSNFSAPNAGFEISVAVGRGAVAVLLSKEFKDEAEFEKLKQSGDTHLHISDKAKWQGAGLYPVGALGAKLNARGGTEPVPNIDPYEFLNDPAKFSSQAGKQRKAAFVEMFGLGRGNPTMERIGGANADHHAGPTQEFPNVQAPVGITNVFGAIGSIFGGGSGGKSSAPASPQPQRDGDFPTAQPAPQPSGDGGSFPTAGGTTQPQAPVKPGCEAPSVVGSAAMAGIGALFTGKDPKAAAMAAGQSAMRQRPKPGCN